MSRQAELTAYGLNVLDAWEDVQDSYFMQGFMQELGLVGEVVAYQGSKQSALHHLAVAMKEMDDEARARGTYEDPPLPVWLLNSSTTLNKNR